MLNNSNNDNSNSENTNLIDDYISQTSSTLRCLSFKDR